MPMICSVSGTNDGTLGSLQQRVKELTDENSELRVLVDAEKAQVSFHTLRNYSLHVGAGAQTVCLLSPCRLMCTRVTLR